MNEFFSPWEQKDISIRQYPAKSPMFYRDVHMMSAIFTADLGAIQSWVNDPALVPLRMPGGRGMAAIHCFEYRDTDIGPYNELSLSVAVQKSVSAVPTFVRAATSLVLRDYHAIIKQLPVNTEPALFGGLDFFGYPKFLADVSFREVANHRICTVRDRKSGDLICEFEMRIRSPNQKSKRVLFNTYPVKDETPLHAKLLVNMQSWTSDFFPSDVVLRTGKHQASKEFQQLNLGRVLHVYYAPRCEAILFMPEQREKA